MGDAGTRKPKVSPEHLPPGTRKEGSVPNEGWGVSEGHRSLPERYPLVKAGTICAIR